MLELFGLLILAAACGSDEVATTPTPTAVATAVPTVAGPLAVYSEDAVIVFDVGARREVRRVAMPDGALSVVFTSKRRVVYIVESNSDVQVHAIDPLSGADDTVARFPRPGDGARFLLSPDGRYAAFAVSDGVTPPSHATVGVVDLRSATARVLATFGVEEFRGLPTPGKWRDDGSGFVVYGDMPVGPHAGTLATLMLDGSVIMHGNIPPSRLSPSGRAVMYDDVNTVGCVFADVQRLRIHDLDTDGDVAVAEDPGRGLVFNEWSPSGDEVLYTRYDTMPARAEDCLPEFDRASGRAYVLSTHGGAPLPVPDVVALRKRWYGGVPVEYACAGGAPLDVWGQCRGDARIVLLNGVPLGSEGRVHLRGIIDADALPADR